MFYKLELQDHIRVPPDLFNLPVQEAVIKRVKKKYGGFISKELGIVIDVSDVKDIGEGVIIAGDGASYYDVKFGLLTFKPELQEVVLGRINDIADFGAFINLGPIEGMIHISQTMDDFVSFSKDKVLSGKESKKTFCYVWNKNKCSRYYIYLDEGSLQVLIAYDDKPVVIDVYLIN